jgi:hypothetical protein
MTFQWTESHKQRNIQIARAHPQVVTYNTSHPTWTHFSKGNSKSTVTCGTSVQGSEQVTGASWCKYRTGKTLILLLSLITRKGPLSEMSEWICKPN